MRKTEGKKIFSCKVQQDRDLGLDSWHLNAENSKWYRNHRANKESILMREDRTRTSQFLVTLIGKLYPSFIRKSVQRFPLNNIWKFHHCVFGIPVRC